MSFDDAIKTIVGRNRDLVQKQGKQTPYTRDTDLIIDALLFQRKCYNNIIHERSKYIYFWQIITHDDYADLKIDKLSLDFLVKMQQNNWTEFRPDKYADIEQFDFSDIPKLVDQMLEAQVFYKDKEQEIYDNIYSIKLNIDNTPIDDTETRGFLKEEIDRKYEDLKTCI